MADGRVEIEVDLDTDELSAGIARMNKTLNRMDGNLQKISRSANQSAGALGMMVSQGRVLASTLAAIGPAAAPIAGVAAGAIGALASSFAAAGAGAALFGAVAITNLQDADKLAKQFQKTWTDFAGQFEKPIMKMAAQSLRIFSGLLKSLTPVVDSAIQGFQQLLTGFEQFTKTKEFQSFINWLSNQAGPSIVMFGKVGGNMLRGLIGIFQAFTPLSNSMGKSLVSLSERFAQWGQSLQNSDKFQRFLTFVQTNGPKVWTLIKQLATLLINLGVALAPVGVKIIEIANGFLQWANSMIQNNPQVATFLGYAFSLGAALKAVIAVVMLVIAKFSMLGPIFSRIGTFISTYVTPRLTQMVAMFRVGAQMIFQNVMRIVTSVGRMAAMIGKGALRVIGFIIRIAGRFSFLAVRALLMGARVAASWVIAMGPVGWVIAIVVALVALIIANWDKVKAWTKKAWEAASQAVNNAAQKMSEYAGRAKDWVVEKIQAALDTISGLWSDFKSVGSDLIDGLIQGVKDMAGRLVEAAKGVVSSAVDAAKNLLNIGSPSRVMMEVGSDFGEGFAIGISDMVREGQRAARGMAAGVVQPLRNIQGTQGETRSIVNNVTVNGGGDMTERELVRLLQQREWFYA